MKTSVPSPHGGLLASVLTTLAAMALPTGTAVAQSNAKATAEVAWSASLTGGGNLTRVVSGTLHASTGVGAPATEATPIPLSGENPGSLDLIKEEADAKGELKVTSNSFTTVGPPGAVSSIASNSTYEAWASVGPVIGVDASAKGWVSPAITDVLTATNTTGQPITLSYSVTATVSGSATVSWPPGFQGTVTGYAHSKVNCSLPGTTPAEGEATDTEMTNPLQTFEDTLVLDPAPPVQIVIAPGATISITLTIDILAEVIVDSPPLAVELLGLSATLERGDVLVAWETASEVDNAGFRLWRAPSADGPFTLLDPALIPAQGSPTQGASYAFLDADFPLQVAPPWYRLEDIDLTGSSTFHDPVMVDDWPGAWWWRLHLPGLAGPRR